MSELKAIAAAARALRSRSEPYVVATVVRVRGSAYRRPGARMLATQDQWVAGSISGGCLERDVLTKGFWRTRGDDAVLVTHDEALDERAGSGCLGEIDILLERITPDAWSERGRIDALEFVETCIERELPGAIATVFASDRPDVPVGARITLLAGHSTSTLPAACAVRAALVREAEALLANASVNQRRRIEPSGVSRGDTRGELSGARRDKARSAPSACVRVGDVRVGDVDALIELVLPPVHLFVFGSGHDAEPVVTLSTQLGWSVSVWDAQPRLSARERLRAADHYLTGSLPDALQRLDGCATAAALVMGHHYAQDQSVLEALLGSRARYIGVLGPRARTDRMLSDSRERGVRIDETSLARVYAPVGLSLGAETPAEIALAILAEAQAALTGSPARALRNQGGAIHALPAAGPDDAAVAIGMRAS